MNAPEENPILQLLEIAYVRMSVESVWLKSLIN